MEETFLIPGREGSLSSFINLYLKRKNIIMIKKEKKEIEGIYSLSSRLHSLLNPPFLLDYTLSSLNSLPLIAKPVTGRAMGKVDLPF